MKKSTTAKGEYLSLISTSTARNPDMIPLFRSQSFPRRNATKLSWLFSSFCLFFFLQFSASKNLSSLYAVRRFAFLCYSSRGINSNIRHAFAFFRLSETKRAKRVVVNQGSAPPSAGKAASPAPAWTSRDAYHWESLAASAAHSVEAPGAPHSCSVAPAPSQPAAPVAPAAPGAPEKPAAPASQSPGAAWKPDSMAAGPSSSAAAFSSSALSSASASGSRSCYHVSFLFLLPNEGFFKPQQRFQGYVQK